MFFLSWLRRLRTSPDTTRSALRRLRNCNRTRNCRLSLEPLEARCVPSAGDLDLTFGSNGIVTTDFGSSIDQPAAVAITPDGKIVAGGSREGGTVANVDFALARYLADGSLDPSFGAGGRVTTALGGSTDDFLRGVIILSDGRVLAGGYSGRDFALVRYTSAGGVDTSFGGKAKGKVLTDIASGSTDQAKAMVVQADGKILLAGVAIPRNSTTLADLALVRYNANGSLDTSFDRDGKLTARFAYPLYYGGLGAHSVSLAVYPSTAPGGLAGKVLTAVVLSHPDGSGSELVLIRSHADGSVDTSFGGGTGSLTFGRRRTDPDLAIQPDGKFVLSFRDDSLAPGEQPLMLARFDTAGNLDASFGAGGMTGAFLVTPAGPKSLVLQPDGKLLVSGYEYNVSQNRPNPLVLRFDPNGALDPTFGTSGKAIQSEVTLRADRAIDIAVQADGRIVLAGSDSSQRDFVLMRLQGDAALTAELAAPATALNADYGQLPLAFEANVGQTDAQVNFLARGAGYATFLTPSEAVLSLGSQSVNDVVRLQILGGNPDAPSAGLDELPGRSNYLLGNDPSGWRTDVANYGKVRYDDVYAGIDVIYYGNQRNLEYDFIVAPGADPGAIRLGFDGAQRLSLDGAGNLVLDLPGEDLIQHAPVVYQEIGGVRRSVAGSYRLLDGGQVGFTVGVHDATRPLVIDPVLSYSTYLGGSDLDIGTGIAVDAAGNAYVTGYTLSSNFPTLNPLQSQRPSYEVFVTKLNAAGNALVYSTYLGGSGSDYGYGIALDSSGNACVTGLTTSSDLPLQNALQMTYGGNYDAFVVQLNATGSALLYATYLGGSGSERANGGEGSAIAVDASGYIYVAGSTSSTNFPTTPGALQTTYGGATDAFVTKLDPTQAGADSLIYSTYLGSNYSGATDYGFGIAVDGSGNAYVTGRTGGFSFPTTENAFQTQLSGFAAAFVSKLDASGSALLYSTYFGGSHTPSGGDGITVGRGIAVDGAGDVYVTGSTSCSDLPTKNALQPQYGGIPYDAFVAKFNPGLSGSDSLVYSTYLGGRGYDNEDGLYGAIAVDAAGNAYVTGTTRALDFPVKNAFQGTYGGGSNADAFVAKLANDGSRFIYSSYLGSVGGDYPKAIAVDVAGNAYVVGRTFSTDFPTVNPFQSKLLASGRNASTDAFVTKIANPPAAGPGLDVKAAATATAGAAVSFSVAAVDAVGNTLTGFTGTVHLTSSDPQAVLPADYTFTAEDQGVHTFTVTLKTAGQWSLTATASGMLGGQTSIQVNPAAATRLLISGPSSTKANSPFSITVKAYDDYGNVATGYRGTVHFTSSDATATLPANYTFTAADNGVHTFTGLKLKTKGKHTITVIDTLFASLAGNLTIDVI